MLAALGSAAQGRWKAKSDVQVAGSFVGGKGGALFRVAHWVHVQALHKSGEAVQPSVRYTLILYDSATRTARLQAAGWSQTDQRILEMTHVASGIKTVSA